MDRLTYDNLVVLHNADIKYAKKKKLKLSPQNLYYSKLDCLHDTQIPDSYPIDFSPYKVKTFSLETLMHIISVVESLARKNIKKDIVFYSNYVMIMSDSFTVSLTEYFILYFKSIYGINVYITYGNREGNDMIVGLEDNERRVHNGFFTEEEGRSMRYSFLLNWNIGNTLISDDDYYCNHNRSRRFKAYVGIGPWDASVAITNCISFLESAGFNQEVVNSIGEVIGELAPNSVEHGNSSCLIDISYENLIGENKQDLTNISVVVFNFSEKLIWTDLYDKIFNNSQNITYMKDRVNRVKAAWDVHSKSFSNDYTDTDFYNLMPFQKISGRKGDRKDGGLGIKLLIQNIQKYSQDDYCYVLSGHTALSMDRALTIPDMEDYVAFNKDQKYVEMIPDAAAVMHTRFYMPGVAYNLNFYFEK